MMRLAATFAAFVAACLAVIWSPSAHALALGEIELQSRLNEPLTARIPIRLSPGDDFQSLRVSVAEPEDFARSGLQYSDFLISVELTLAPPNGQQPPYVLVSSSKIAREPFLDLMIEAKALGNRVLRNYTVLLDPPVLAAAMGARETPATNVPSKVPPPAQQPVPVPVKPAPAAAAQAPSDNAGTPPEALPSVSSADPNYFQAGAGWVEGDQSTAAPGRAQAPDRAPKQYGPVGRKETLWSIAYALRPDPSITMDQMQLAIFRANPNAFDGNINRMLTGATLDIPSAAAIRAIDAAAAKAEVARQRAGYVPPAPRQAQPATRPAVAEPVPEFEDFDTAEDDFFEPATDIGQADEFDEAPGFDDESDADTAATAGESEAMQFDEDVAQQSSDAPAEPQPVAEPAPASARPMTALERLRAERNGTLPATMPPPAQAAADDEADLASAEADQEPEEGLDGSTSDDGAVTEPVTPSAAPAAPPVAPIAAASDEGGGLPWGLIGGLAALILGALAFLGLRRRRATAATDREADMAVPVVAEDDRADDESDDTDLGDTAVLDEAEFGLGDDAKPKARDDVEPDVAVIDEPDGLGETAILDAADTTPDSAEQPKPAAEPDNGAHDEAMAATMQFDANTISLDLSGDDPISEADVHLAYGATEEAASVMEAAVQAAPDNAAYRNKLAEVYFSGNAVDKFVAHARDSESVLKAGAGDGWQKLLILGQQIAPDEPLFAQADAGELQTADFDFGSDPDPLDVGDDASLPADEDDGLSFDIDEPEPSPIDTSDDSSPVSDAEPEPEPESEDDGALEFDLSELEGSDTSDLTLDKADSETVDVDSADDDSDSLEFDFGDLDLDSSTDTETPSPVESAADTDDDGVEFDLGDFDLDASDSEADSDSAPDDAPPPASTAGPTADSGATPSDDDAFDFGDLDLGSESESPSGDLDDVLGELGEFDLDDEAIEAVDGTGVAVDAAGLDALLGEDEGEPAAVPEPADDDVGTKLDLARAYLDMGDKDLAESLLTDVTEAGDDAQKAEAKELLAKLKGD